MDRSSCIDLCISMNMNLIPKPVNIGYSSAFVKPDIYLSRLLFGPINPPQHRDCLVFYILSSIFYSDHWIMKICHYNLLATSITLFPFCNLHRVTGFSLYNGVFDNKFNQEFSRCSSVHTKGQHIWIPVYMYLESC